MKKFSTFIVVVKKFYTKLVNDQRFDGGFGEHDLTEEECVLCGPSLKSVKRIMDFARAYDVMETKSAGTVEMNLN